MTDPVIGQDQMDAPTGSVWMLGIDFDEYWIEVAYFVSEADAEATQKLGEELLGEDNETVGDGFFVRKVTLFAEGDTPTPEQLKRLADRDGPEIEWYTPLEPDEDDEQPQPVAPGQVEAGL